jgi:hypothetical protein
MVAAETYPQPIGTIWMLELDEPVPVITPRVNAEFRRAGPGMASALSAMSGRDSVLELLNRFETGRQCYTACIGEQLAAYGWVSFDDEMIGELNLRIRLLPGEVYIWDCVTAPPFRGYRLYSALLAYILTELRLQPVCRAWIGADLDNIASQKGMARAGFHHVADLLVAHLSALRQFWVEGKPGVPERLVDEARRAFLGSRDIILEK